MMVLRRYHIACKKLSHKMWSVCTEEKNGKLIMTPLWMLNEEEILNLPHFEIQLNNEFQIERASVDEVLDKWRTCKCQK